MENLSKIGQEIIEICKFVELNMIAARKILKKFDKQFKSFSIPQAPYFLTKCLSEPNHPFQRIIDMQNILKAKEILAECIANLRPNIMNREGMQKRPEKSIETSSIYKQFSGKQQLKEPLLETSQRRESDYEPSQNKKLLSSTHNIKLLKSKLSILESTLAIIDEAIASVKYSASYANKLNAKLQISQYIKNLKVQNDYIRPLQQPRKEVPRKYSRSDEVAIKGIQREETGVEFHKLIKLDIETDHYPSLYLVLLQTFFYVLTYAIALPQLIQQQKDVYVFYLGTLLIKLIYSQVSAQNYRVLFMISSFLMSLLCILRFWAPQTPQLYYITLGLIAMASGCKVIDRRFISDHVILESTFKYNIYYAFITLSAILLSFLVNFYKYDAIFMMISQILWIAIGLAFALVFREPIRENANYLSYQIQFGRKSTISSSSFERQYVDVSLIDFFNKPFLVMTLVFGFAMTQKFAFITATPITFPWFILRNNQTPQTNELLKGQLYLSYLIIIVLGFFLIFIIITFCMKYHERRILMFALAFNFVGLIIFADVPFSFIVSQEKFVIGFTLISLSNLLVESAAQTYLMKNLAHHIPSKTQILNAGFFLEFIEVMAKYTTILLITIGIKLDETLHLIHNFLIMVFIVCCITLMLLTLLTYGRLRIRIKSKQDHSYHLLA